MRNAFAVLFFVAVGMLFDYRAAFASPGLILGVLAIILLVKPLAAMVIVIAGGHSLKTALTVAGGLAQIGEFSFIVADMAKSLGLMPGTGSTALVAGAIISISLNPVIFRTMLSLEPRLAKWKWLARRHESRSAIRGAEANEAAKHLIQDPGAIVVGYGPVGRTVTRLLAEFGINPTIIETNIDAVVELQQRGQAALYGDATRSDILRASGITSAAYLVVTVPHAEISLRIIQQAREVAPMIRVLTRASYINQHDDFVEAGAAIVRYDEAETAAALAEALLRDIDAPAERLAAAVSAIRKELTPRPRQKLSKKPLA
jgi:CPA2 family monovalent cation:H+ antiporter-2